jgi:tetratricopeptide (TPR) repeat protein
MRTLILEKVPLAVLSIGASVIAFYAQKKGGAVRSLEAIPLASRAANALISYVVYIANFVWPTGLSSFYPYNEHWHAWMVAIAGIALAAMSMLVAIAFRKRPYLAAGWFWYLGTLAPVIGIIQVGSQARADRYTYVPLIGISIMLAWAVSEAIARWPSSKNAFAGVAIVACSGWLLITWLQISYWKDGPTLYRRAIAVTEGNYLAHENLGVDLAGLGQNQEALRELYLSLEEKPNQPRVHNSIGGVLFSMGRKDEAIDEFYKSLRLQPQDAVAHTNLGNVLVDVGRINEAINELNTALRLDPGQATAYYGLGRVLVMQNRPDDAATYFSEALRINPAFTQARQQLQSLRKR